MGRVWREAPHEKSLNDSVEESYGFPIARLGPEERDLDRRPHWIRTGSQYPEGDNPNQEEYDLNEIYSIPGAPGENIPTSEDEDEFVATPDGGSQWGRESCLERHGNDDEDDRDILVRGSQRTRGGRLASTQNTQRGSVNGFKLPISTQP